jgi:general secretion pathway protein C
MANAALIAIAALFGAQGLSAVASLALPLRPALCSHRIARELPVSDRPTVSAAPILRRNPFDSVTGSLLGVALAEEAPLPAGPDPLEAPPCTRIHAVVIAAFEDSEMSVAALEVEGTEPVLRRRGGEIGAAKVEYIGVDRVFVRDAGKLCRTQLFAPKAVVQAAEHVEATPHTGGIDPKIAQGITRDGAGQYRIERSVLQRLLDDPSELMKGVQMTPEKEGDRTVGARLVGVRPDRLLGVLGLQDGDVIRSLNGYEFSSPERMLEAYARLRDATELRLDFSRGGQVTTNAYVIQ